MFGPLNPIVKKAVKSSAGIIVATAAAAGAAKVYSNWKVFIEDTRKEVKAAQKD